MGHTLPRNHQPAILLPMQPDPVEEWRRLTTLYSEMGDLEIRELASQISDLTETAQQVLRDELKKRNVTQQMTDDAFFGRDQEERRDPSIYPPSGDGGIDYSWKVPLCTCDSYTLARQLGEMLRRAKVDAWIDRSGELQILVAADQLEQARAVATQTIPQDIIDETREIDSAPAYEIPRCPKCKAEDPTLESVEPSNNWLCESCGYTWSEPAPDPTAS